MGREQSPASPTLALPEGTVTFLFTDIEGSTNLLKLLGEKYISLLDDHHRILREIFAKWNGREVDTEGDAFFVSFRRATEALGAVVEAQRALNEHQWPEGVFVRVRMGLHTGEPWTGADRYVGMDVHRAARIAHAGYGGQVLLSETTAALLRGNLPEDVTIRDLGLHLLKDMRFPEHIRQLVIEGLPNEFPPLRSLEFEETLDVSVLEPPPLPSFLTENGWRQRAKPAFVGRDSEMAFMSGFLDALLQERSEHTRGNMLFVTGDAGSGKTSLMDAFSRLALVDFPELLIAKGLCSAFTGAGDPYQPWRSVMGILTGDLESMIASHVDSREQAVNLWRSFPLVVNALAGSGPDLIDVMVSAASLKSRVKKSVVSSEHLLQRLFQAEIAGKKALAELRQSQLFDQYGSVLRTISKKHPILIMLDDLQWADSGSINLLFHLARTLAGCQVLILGAYRPEEIALGRDERRHPLEPVLEELKREFGDLWVNLNQSEGEAFVHEFLESEPNRLSDLFRKTLLKHTGGQALFTVETLRDLQERGDLVKDDNGCWIESPSLDWESLPTQVEGVIEARIERLEEELRDILSVAAVEGEDFTAQVVARIQEIQERKLLRTLSRELEKRHQLVKEQKEEHIGTLALTRYRFAHALFQRYLYNDLSEGERRLIHGEIANILEELYTQQLEGITVQLASHYAAARDAEKAVPYLLQAGDKSRQLFAFGEAAVHYNRAAEMLSEQGDIEQAAKTMMKVGLAYHSGFDFEKSRDAYNLAFELFQQLSLVSLPAEMLADTPLKLAYTEPILDPGVNTGVYSSSLIIQLFSGLLQRSASLVEVYPDIAERWEMAEDGGEYIFHLRQGVKWSDGKPVTAYDFEYAWKRILDPAADSPNAPLFFDIKNARVFHQGDLSNHTSVGITAQDDSTLIVQLEAPTGYLLQLLSCTQFFPVPQHVVEQHGDTWTDGDTIVTCGPFRVESRERDKSLVLVRNPDYHGNRTGNIRRVEISVLTYHEWYPMEMELYLAGSVDMLSVYNLPPVERERFVHSGESTYYQAPQTDTMFLKLDPSCPPYDDRRIRQALSMAIDRNRLANIVLDGEAVPASGGFVPPGLPGYQEGINLPYEPQRARALLEEAGFPNGDGFPKITFHYALRDYIFKFLAASWRENLGLDVVCERSEKRPDSQPIQWSGWQDDYPDPDSFLRTCPHVQSAGGGRQGEYDGLVEQARRCMNQEERIRIYQRAERILVEEAVVIPVIHNTNQIVTKPWLKNIRPPLLDLGPWKDWIIEPH